MLPAVFGISLLAHLTIMFAARTKIFFNASTKKNIPRAGRSAPNKAFSALSIAVITEFVIVLVIASSFTILGAGALSEKSNYKIIKSALIEFENKSLGFECVFRRKCQTGHPDASIPLN